MEVARLKVLLRQVLEYPDILLEDINYEESLKIEIRQKYFELRQCSKILVDLMSLVSDGDPARKGLIFSGTLEDVLKNKEHFLENSSLHVKSEFTEDPGVNKKENMEDNEDNWGYEDELDVKVKLEEIELEVKPKRKVRTHYCENCNFQATNGKALRKHVTLLHGRKEKPYKKCKFCMEEFQMRKDQTMNSRYRNHLEKLHVKQKYSDFQEAFDKMDCLKCSVCEKAVYGSKPSLTLNNLNQHMRDKHDNKRKEKEMIPCPKCDKEIKANYLKMHIEITHNDAKFTCDQCGKSFKNKHQMRLHVKMHSSDHTESFKCEICDESIPQYGSLRRHIYRKHGGRKFNPVTCEECGKQLGDKSKLTKHKDSVHLNKKPFKCDICQLNMSRIDNLKQHKLKVHKSDI